MRWVATYLDAKQAASNDAVAPGLRTPHGRRLVRIADVSIAVTAIGALVLIVLLGIGSRSPVGYAAAGLVVVAGAVVGTLAVGRLARARLR